jgi:uncharacterized sulfatase
VVLMPEAEMHRRAGDRAPGDLAFDREHYPVRRVLDAAELAAARDAESVPRLRRMTADADSVVRYWAAIGLLIRGPAAVAEGREELIELLKDSSPSVRIAAAEALAAHGTVPDSEAALGVLVESADLRRNEYLDAVAALNALDHLGAKAVSRREELASFPREAAGVPARMGDYVDRMMRHLLGERSP